MKELLKKYCDIIAPSGMEDEIREAIIADIKGSGCEYSVDPMGNLVAFKKGRKRRNKKVIFSAHMDEVGFIVKHIDDEGYIWFGCLGGIDRRVVSARRVVFCESGIHGVIASKSIHLQPPEERGKCEPTDDMNIDIGAKNREEALEYVHVGDCATFEPSFEPFGNGFVRSKALDDRLGCAVLVNMINSDLEYDTYFAFNTCEEVGCDGGTEVAHYVNPDIAIAIEATTAGDVLDVPKTQCACQVGGGAVISFMDGGTIYDKKLVDIAVETAERNGIKWQFKNVIAGGNEARSYQTTASGARVLAISAPARYIHTASDVLHFDDIDAVNRLAFRINERSFNDD